MKDISFIEGYSSNFGEKTVKTISAQSLEGKVDFIMKPGNHCCVSGSLGKPKELRRLTEIFIEKYNVNTLLNQVHRTGEAKAMYELGFRIPETKPNTGKYYSLPQTIAKIKEHTSVLMAWKGELPDATK